MNSNTKIQIIIPEESLLLSVQSQLSKQYSLHMNNDLTEYLTGSDTEKTALILCHLSILGDEQAVVISKLKAASPNARILVIGPKSTSHEQVLLLKHGARGYFDCSSSLTKLNEAVKCIFHGEVWIERHVISGLIEELTHVPEISKEQRQAIATLSPKELEVAQLVSHGATNKMIAKNMAITERTVKAHLTAVFHKIGLSDRLSLAIFFRDLRD